MKLCFVCEKRDEDTNSTDSQDAEQATNPEIQQSSVAGAKQGSSAGNSPSAAGVAVMASAQHQG